jgi:hypothetical protein
MNFPLGAQLSKDKCWICGYKKMTQSEILLLPYICHWCSSENVVTLINDIILEAKERLSQGELDKCEDIDVLSFVADIGTFGAHHPYFKQFSRMMSIMAVQVALEHKYTPDKLVKAANGKGVQEKWERVLNCIAFLMDVGLLEKGQGRYMHERYRPSDLLLNLTASVELADVEKGLPPRTAACLAGYAWLYGIAITINWLKEGAKDEAEARGIMRLYAKGEDGKPSIPKSFTTPIMYIIGHLAKGYDEFSEAEFRAWLSPRGVSGKDADFLTNVLAKVAPLSHRLVNPIYAGGAYHFKFNPLYVRMRERYRERGR